MKTSTPHNWNCADPHYEDLVVYIETDRADEWRFTVTLDRESNTIYDSRPLYAHDLDAPFIETDMPVPDDVQAAFQAIRPQMVAQLTAMMDTTTGSTT